MITIANLGNLIVTGASRFLNNIYTSGNIITPGKDIYGIEPAAGNFGHIGTFDKRYYYVAASQFRGTDGSDKYLQMTDTDIYFNAKNSATPNTWDGTNTSLKTAVTNAKGTVKQSPTSTNADYEILFSGTADNTEHIENVRKSQWLKFNPNNNVLWIGGDISLADQGCDLQVHGGTVNFGTKNSSSNVSGYIQYSYGNGTGKAALSVDDNITSSAGPYWNTFKSDGSLQWAGRLALASSSDIRLKTNIQDTEVNNALEIINQIKIRSFDWISDMSHQKIGVIADELEEIDTRFVDEGSGGYTPMGYINPKTVNTFYWAGYMTKAIQELSAKCDALENELNELKNK